MCIYIYIYIYICIYIGIIVDEKIMNNNSRLQLFECMGVIKAKGYVDPVPVFAYQQSLYVDEVYLSNKTDIIGRMGYLESLRLGIKDFLRYLVC
jgi:hypothetical protein